MAYAEGTIVSVEKSKTELKHTILKNGGTGYEAFEREDKAGIQFKFNERLLRFIVAFPGPDNRMFTRTPTGLSRAKDVAFQAYEGEQRRRWRALILAIKAKFEIVTSGISTFEEEFLPYTVLPDGRTVAEHAIPMVEQAYLTGKIPGSLIALPETTE